MLTAALSGRVGLAGWCRLTLYRRASPSSMCFLWDRFCWLRVSSVRPAVCACVYVLVILCWSGANRGECAGAGRELHSQHCITHVTVWQWGKTYTHRLGVQTPQIWRGIEI